MAQIPVPVPKSRTFCAKGQQLEDATGEQTAGTSYPGIFSKRREKESVAQQESFPVMPAIMISVIRLGRRSKMAMCSLEFEALVLLLVVGAPVVGLLRVRAAVNAAVLGDALSQRGRRARHEAVPIPPLAWIVRLGRLNPPRALAALPARIGQ